MRRKLSDTRRVVADAALRCFERHEPSDISMNDIAREAGVSRQAAYRAFSSRTELIETVLNMRLTDIGESVERYFREAESLEKALVECAFRAVQAGRSDALFVKVLKSCGDHRVEQFIFRGSDDILAVTKRLWGPLLAKAREEGLINPDISDERYLDWIQQIEAVLSMRDDFSEEAQRQMLRDFLVPSIITRRNGRRSEMKTRPVHLRNASRQKRDRDPR